jgi:peroxiredoxin Q/BCP
MSFRRLSLALSFAALSGLLALAGFLFAASPASAGSPKVGASAPDFRLQDQNGEWVTLQSQRGKWVVLYFYPKDNTPGCTSQACGLRDNIFAFRREGAVILGVSVDDVASKKAFAQEHSLPFPVLADSGKAVTKSYGVLTSMLGVWEYSRRDTFIIDPQGRVARHFEKVDPEGHAEMVLAEIRRLKAAAPKAG